MFQTRNVIPEHAAPLHCIWVPSGIGAAAPLAAVWTDTPDSSRQENVQRSTEERCSRSPHGVQPSGTHQTTELRKGGGELQSYGNLMELADPRPHNGVTYLYRGMPLLPISFECDWMRSDDALRRALIQQMFVLASEGQFC
jgi:hypothetical protein